MADRLNWVSQQYYTRWMMHKYGGVFQQYYQWFKDNQQKTPQQLEELRWKLLRSVLLQAQRAPYYRELFRQNNIDPEKINDARSFARIPLLTKVLLRDQLEGLVAENADRRQLVFDSTGGSTGLPTPYYHDLEYRQRNDALNLLNMERTGWIPGEPWVKIWAAHFDMPTNSMIKERLTYWARNVHFFSAHELSDDTMLSG